MKRALAALLTWVLLSLLAAAPASAHAVLLGTSPTDGEIAPSVPDAVVLTFNEPVDIRQVSLVGPTGSEPLAAQLVNAEVHARLPAALDEGTYVVNYRVVSADGHPIGGAFTFSIGHESDTFVSPASDSAPVTWLIRIAQALAFAGLLIACGLALFAAWSVRGEAPGRESLIRRVGIGAVVVAAIGLVLGLPAAELDANGDGLAELWNPGTWTAGAVTLAGFAALVGVSGALVGVISRNRSIRVAGAVVGLASLVITGHTRTFGPALLTLSADLVHVVAVGAWVGGVVGLVLLIGTPSLPTVIPRFSKLAVILLAAVGVSGLVLGWRIVGSIGALTSTSYGTVLIIKALVVAAAVSVAFLNRRWLVAPRSVALRAEATVLVSVALLTGVLVHLNPAVPIQQHSVMKTVDGVTIHASIGPCQPGDNVVTVMVHGADVPVPDITARTADGAIGPLEVPVAKTAAGQFTGPVKLVVDGEWTIDIGVRISTYREASAILTCTT